MSQPEGGDRPDAGAGEHPPLAEVHGDLALYSVTPEDDKPFYLYPEFDTFVLVSVILFFAALFDEGFETEDAYPLITVLAAVYMITCTVRRARL